MTLYDLIRFLQNAIDIGVLQAAVPLTMPQGLAAATLLGQDAEANKLLDYYFANSETWGDGNSAVGMTAAVILPYLRGHHFALRAEAKREPKCASLSNAAGDVVVLTIVTDTKTPTNEPANPDGWFPLDQAKGPAGNLEDLANDLAEHIGMRK